MPIPQPTSGESESEYVSRIMGNKDLRAEYPNEQLAAIAYNTHRKAKDHNAKKGYKKGD